MCSGTLLSAMMYGALKCAGTRLPSVGLLSLPSSMAKHFSVGVVARRSFAVRTDFSETVYDNEDGGPKCRGIELLRDPTFNKACLTKVSIVIGVRDRHFFY